MQQWVMAPFNGTEDDAIIAARQCHSNRHDDASSGASSLALSPENENCKDEIVGNEAHFCTERLPLL